jgi:hypothetical protein
MVAGALIPSAYRSFGVSCAQDARRTIMGDKGKGSGKTLKKAPKDGKAGKHGLRPHEQRGQADTAPAIKKVGK